MIEDKTFDLMTNPVFWRIAPEQGEDGRVEFDADNGTLGVLCLPVDLGALVVFMDGHHKAENSMAQHYLPRVFATVEALAMRHRDCSKDAVQWIEAGADGVIRHITVARNAAGVPVLFRIDPVKSGMGQGGELLDFGAIYGTPNRLALYSGLLAFPRLVARVLARSGVAPATTGDGPKAKPARRSLFRRNHAQ